MLVTIVVDDNSSRITTGEICIEDLALVQCHPKPLLTPTLNTTLSQSKRNIQAWDICMYTPTKSYNDRVSAAAYAKTGENNQNRSTPKTKEFGSGNETVRPVRLTRRVCRRTYGICVSAPNGWMGIGYLISASLWHGICTYMSRRGWSATEIG